jgi:hypothetical protein
MRRNRLPDNQNFQRELKRALKSEHRKEEWIRLPPGGGQCEVTGIRRTVMNQLVLPCEANGFKPPVRSVSLKKPGGIKGCRLVHLPSLLAYLAKLEAEQMAAATTAAAESVHA